MHRVFILVFSLFFIFNIRAESSIKVFPETCTELLPEYNAYIEYLEDLGALWSYSSRFYAKQVFKLLAIRDLYQKNSLDMDNPLNSDIKNILCLCREPIKETMVTASSYEMKKCIQKKIATMIKTEIKKYKIMMSKRELLQKVFKDKAKYQKQIARLKKIAKEDVNSSL